MHPLKFLHTVVNYANPIYKIAATAVMCYSLYHKFKFQRAENERNKRNEYRQRGDHPP
jgi:hypothetical protein